MRREWAKIWSGGSGRAKNESFSPTPPSIPFSAQPVPPPPNLLTRLLACLLDHGNETSFTQAAFLSVFMDI